MAKETGEEQERETVCGERGEGSAVHASSTRATGCKERALDDEARKPRRTFVGGDAWDAVYAGWLRFCAGGDTERDKRRVAQEALQEFEERNEIIFAPTLIGKCEDYLRSGRATVGLVRVALPLMIRAWYERAGNEVGGLLHTMLDDGNVDDEDVELDHARAKESGDPLAIAIVEAIGSLPESEREAACSGTDDEERWYVEKSDEPKEVTGPQMAPHVASSDVRIATDRVTTARQRLRQFGVDVNACAEKLEAWLAQEDYEEEQGSGVVRDVLVSLCDLSVDAERKARELEVTR